MRDVFEVTRAAQGVAYGSARHLGSGVARGASYTKAASRGIMLASAARWAKRWRHFVIGTSTSRDAVLFEAANSITSALANEFAEATPGCTRPR